MWQWLPSNRLRGSSSSRTSNGHLVWLSNDAAFMWRRKPFHPQANHGCPTLHTDQKLILRAVKG